MSDLVDQARRIQHAANMLSYDQFCEALDWEKDEYSKEKWQDFRKLGEAHRFGGGVLESLVAFYEKRAGDQAPRPPTCNRPGCTNTIRPGSPLCEAHASMTGYGSPPVRANTEYVEVCSEVAHRDRTIYAEHPSVYYEPFVSEDGRVGYRCQTNNAGDCREIFVYFNPSTDTDDGTPNIFVYVGEENDPAQDGSIDTHIALHELEDGPLMKCGHNEHQRDQADGKCHGCEVGEDRHWEPNW